MKVGFVSMPVTGHLNPMTALASKLQSRGNGVVFIGLAVAVILSPVAYSSSYSPQRKINTSSLAISPDGRTAAASSSDRPYVVIYDLEVQQTRGVVHEFITPRSVLFDRSGRYVYVADSTLGVVKKIDSASLQTVSVFLPVTGAFEAALSSDGQTLYVSNENASLLIFFDLPSGRPTSRVTAYSDPHQSVRPMSGAPLLYIIDFWNDKVIVVDNATKQFVGTISGFNQIRSIAVTRDGTTLFAVNGGDNTIAVVDLKSRSITGEISVENDLRAVTLSPDERFLYSSNVADNTISVIDTSSRQVTATICDLASPAQAIAFSAERAALYALDKDFNISRLDSTTNSFVYTIPSQAAMEAAGLTAPNGKGR